MLDVIEKRVYNARVLGDVMVIGESKAVEMSDLLEQYEDAFDVFKESKSMILLNTPKEDMTAYQTATGWKHLASDCKHNLILIRVFNTMSPLVGVEPLDFCTHFKESEFKYNEVIYRRV